MKSFCLIALFALVSCFPRYLSIKRVVQKNCEGYVDTDDIKVIKKDAYYVASILNHPTYSNGYYFLVYGNEWDDAIMIVDDNKFYYMNDSLYKKILYVNSQLEGRGVEIEDIYINRKDSFAIRGRAVEKKYQYKVVDVKDFQELLTERFEYAGDKR